MNTIYLEPATVPAILRGGYSGKKFKVRVCEQMTIPMDAGLWSGGSRDTFSAVNLVTGQSVALKGQSAAPWDQGRREHVVELVGGVVVIEHSMFCGKDMGLTFYVHPDNAAKLLPAPVAELTATEKLVLEATRSYKSSYIGRDRYQMARCETRIVDLATFPTREDWESAKAALIGRGLLNKAGAITVAGRNAVPR